MPTLPTNPHSVGDSGHVNDHNTIVTALESAFYKQSGASSGEASTKNIDVKPWNMPWGIVAKATVTSTFQSSATHTTFQDTGLSVTYTPNTSRLYRITLICNPYPNGTTQAMAFRVMEGSSEKYMWNIAASALQDSSSVAFTFSGYFTAASASSTTYKIQLHGVSSNTQVSDYGSATQPRQFWIEDIGPA